MQLTALRATLIVCLLGVGGDAWAQPPQEADATRVREIALGIISADNARDLSRVLAFYADDAVLLPPNEAPVHGKAAIEPRYEALFAEFDPDIAGEIAELHVTNDLAIVRGFNRGRLKPRTGGDARLLNDVYLMILRRASDGSWRIARLMWHSVTAAQPR